ncbi:MAG: potassium channel family protein [Chloroflexia bacterium]
MRVIVVGCGRVGVELAHRLSKGGHRVTVVDEKAANLEDLPPDFQGTVLEGDPLSEDVLRRAGIEEADGLAAVTPSDPLNAVVGHTARALFRVPRVVVRCNRPGFRAVYELFGLQVISPASWDALRLMEMLTSSQPRPVLAAGHGEVEVYEISVSQALTGRTLQELVPGETGQVVALVRSGRALRPSGDERVQTGDLLYVSIAPESLEELQRWWAGLL